ncbi:MAG TPA: hypothetical protein VKU41_04440, partial [Polyangiaceae bacterium]|nr:hypothetical protein [Polyangiaceae bacterium]
TDAVVTLEGGRAIARAGPSGPWVVPLGNADKVTVIVTRPGFARLTLSVEKNRLPQAVNLEPAFASPSVESCGPAKGALQQGQVSLDLEPNGTTANVLVAPPLQNTSAGNCVAARFRVARGPSFQGTPIHLTERFQLRVPCNCPPADPLCVCL